MLVLSRKPGEQVVIDGDITLTVVKVEGKRVRLAFDAPDRVRILRGEMACWQDNCLDGGSGRKPDWSRATECGPGLEQPHRKPPAASASEPPPTPSAATEE
jgi:carbon storage regulator